MKRKKTFMLPMDLQLFAEGEGEGEGAETGGDSGTGEESPQGEGSGEKDGPQSFDGFLKEGKNQEEFDRRVREAVSGAVEAAQEKWRILTDDKVSEAEKLAKMTDGEKAQYLQQKREKELTDREAAVTRKELMAEAKNKLAEKKLPPGLAETLNYTDAESCDKSMEAVEKAFREAVEAAVNERLKGDRPPGAPPDGDDASLEKQIQAIMGLQ